jgi:hypothetical protein
MRSLLNASGCAAAACLRENRRSWLRVKSACAWPKRGKVRHPQQEKPSRRIRRIRCRAGARRSAPDRFPAPRAVAVALGPLCAAFCFAPPRCSSTRLHPWPWRGHYDRPSRGRLSPLPSPPREIRFGTRTIMPLDCFRVWQALRKAGGHARRARIRRRASGPLASLSLTSSCSASAAPAACC